MTINIGIDLSIKAQSQAQIRNEKGEKLGADYSFDISKESLNNLYAQAKQYAGAEGKVRFVIEATGMSWFVVAVYGKTHDCEVVRVKAHKVKDLRKFYSRHRKDDKLDAKTLAMMPLVDPDGIHEVYLAPALNFALTRRTRQREHLVDLLIAQKNRIQALLDWALPGITGCFCNPLGKLARMFYRYYVNPFEVQKMTPDELAQSLSTISGEKIDSATVQTIYDCARQACALYESSGYYIDFEEIVQELLREIELLESYEEELEEVALEIKRLYDKLLPEKHIESLPGVGERLGPALYGLISDAGRFRREKQCRAFIGFVPRQESSGTTDKKGLIMSQAGPASGRRDFYLAADIARQWDPQLAKVYYNEMVYKGHCHTQAVCAVAVRMISRVLRILKDNRTYELRDVDGRPITKQEAKAIIKERYTVPVEVRQRLRNRQRRERDSNSLRDCLEKNIPDLNRSQNNSIHKKPMCQGSSKL